MSSRLTQGKKLRVNRVRDRMRRENGFLKLRMKRVLRGA